MRSSPTVVRPAALLVAIFLASAPAAAQQTRKAPLITVSPAVAAADVFTRAQRLVAEGQGPAGRAVVDSALAAAPEGSEAYAEALFWRASLAATAAEAERDYRTLAVEYSMSSRAADALMRLAQLELARGGRAQAIGHLERLVLEHPTSPARPRASYWMARVYFDGGDAPRACAALDAARANARPTDVELRNQLDSYAARCQGVARQVTGGGVALAQGAPAPSAPPPAAAPADESPFSGAATPDAALPPRAPAGAAPAVAPAASPETSPPASSGVALAAAAASAPVPAGAPSRLPATGARRTVFAVQLAAYAAAAPAEALVRRLRARGIDARVSGGAAPFRVRVGRYATRAEAQREAVSLGRGGQQGAWVVTEPAP